LLHLEPPSSEFPISHYEVQYKCSNCYDYYFTNPLNPSSLGFFYRNNPFTCVSSGTALVQKTLHTTTSQGTVDGTDVTCANMCLSTELCFLFNWKKSTLSCTLYAVGGANAFGSDTSCTTWYKIPTSSYTNTAADYELRNGDILGYKADGPEQDTENIMITLGNAYTFEAYAYSVSYRAMSAKGYSAWSPSVNVKITMSAIISLTYDNMRATISWSTNLAIGQTIVIKLWEHDSDASDLLATWSVVLNGVNSLTVRLADIYPSCYTDFGGEYNTQSLQASFSYASMNDFLWTGILAYTPVAHTTSSLGITYVQFQFYAADTQIVKVSIIEGSLEHWFAPMTLWCDAADYCTISLSGFSDVSKTLYLRGYDVTGNWADVVSVYYTASVLTATMVLSADSITGGATWTTNLPIGSVIDLFFYEDDFSTLYPADFLIHSVSITLNGNNAYYFKVGDYYKNCFADGDGNQQTIYVVALYKGTVKSTTGNVYYYPAAQVTHVSGSTSASFDFKANTLQLKSAQVKLYNVYLYNLYNNVYSPLSNFCTGTSCHLTFSSLSAGGSTYTAYLYVTDNGGVEKQVTSFTFTTTAAAAPPLTAAAPTADADLPPVWQYAYDLNLSYSSSPSLGGGGVVGGDAMSTTATATATTTTWKGSRQLRTQQPLSAKTNTIGNMPMLMLADNGHNNDKYNNRGHDGGHYATTYADTYALIDAANGKDDKTFVLASHSVSTSPSKSLVAPKLTHLSTTAATTAATTTTTYQCTADVNGLSYSFYVGVALQVGMAEIAVPTFGIVLMKELRSPVFSIIAPMTLDYSFAKGCLSFPPLPPQIVLTSPSSGDKWGVGTTSHVVQWDYWNVADTDAVELCFFQSSGTKVYCAQSVANGEHKLTLDSSHFTADSSYYVIATVAAHGIQSQSDVFQAVAASSDLSAKAVVTVADEAFDSVPVSFNGHLQTAGTVTYSMGAGSECQSRFTVYPMTVLCVAIVDIAINGENVYSFTVRAGAHIEDASQLSVEGIELSFGIQFPEFSFPPGSTASYFFEQLGGKKLTSEVKFPSGTGDMFKLNVGIENRLCLTTLIDSLTEASGDDEASDITKAAEAVAAIVDMLGMEACIEIDVQATEVVNGGMKLSLLSSFTAFDASAIDWTVFFDTIDNSYFQTFLLLSGSASSDMADKIFSEILTSLSIPDDVTYDYDIGHALYSLSTHAGDDVPFIDSNGVFLLGSYAGSYSPNDPPAESGSGSTSSASTLDSGAIAGISIAVIVFVIVAVLLTVYLLRRAQEKTTLDHDPKLAGAAASSSENEIEMGDVDINPISGAAATPATAAGADAATTDVTVTPTVATTAAVTPDTTAATTESADTATAATATTAGEERMVMSSNPMRKPRKPEPKKPEGGGNRFDV
jgi:hypothetical protein